MLVKQTDSDPVLSGMIDSHFHALSMREKGLDPVESLERCFQGGFAAAVDVAVDTEGFEERLELLSPFERVFLTAGLSPFHAGSPGLIDRLRLLETQIVSPRVVAVGEIGLDRHWDYGTPEEQRDLFVAQLELAAGAGLPIVVHNRESDRELVSLIEGHRPPEGGIMHCYSSDYPTAAMKARDQVRLDTLRSAISGFTYKRSEAMQEAARRLPAASLLMETDSPYLAPVPERGRPCHPALVAHTYAFVANLRRMAVEELVAQVRSNFSRFFGIGP